MESCKVYVPVEASFNEDGSLLPRQLTWEDGEKYVIDRVIDVRPAAAARAGGQGDRYTVEVNGRRTYIFFERSMTLSGNNLGRWFVERRQQARE